MQGRPALSTWTQGPKDRTKQHLHTNWKEYFSTLNPNHSRLELSLCDGRTLWGRVLELSRRAVVEKTVLQQAVQVVPQVKALIEALGSLGEQSDLASIRKMVRASEKSKDVLAACKASQEQGAPEQTQELEEILGSLANSVGSLPNGPAEFSSMLQTLWVNKGEFAIMPSQRIPLLQVYVRGVFLEKCL